MGYLVKLDQRRRKPHKDAVKNVEARLMHYRQLPPLMRNITNPRIVIPRLGTESIRNLEISDGATHALLELLEREGDSAYKPTRLCLAELDREETATPYAGSAFLKKHGCRYATAPDLLGFLQLGTTTDMYDGAWVVALGTHIRDKFDHRYALAFCVDRIARKTILDMLFAERIRPDWLILIAAEAPVTLVPKPRKASVRVE
jgi:hypothetical protein